MLVFFQRITEFPIVRRAAKSSSLRAALFVFFLTRLIVLAVLIASAHAGRVAEQTAEHGLYEFTFSAREIDFPERLRAIARDGDGGWYLDIAQNGYKVSPFSPETQQNWAFFPLFPLIWRAAAAVTGEFLLTGMALSHLFFFAALVLIYKIARESGWDEAAAERSILYLAIFPTAYFFSLPLTESLFLMLSAASFYAARRERWAAACIVCALGSATRATGAMLIPALLFMFWQKYGKNWRRSELLWFAITPLGLFAFMAHLYRVTGNAFAFKDILAAWGRSSGFFLAPLLDFLKNPWIFGQNWDFRLLNFSAAALALACGVVLFKQKQFSLAIYAFLCQFVTLSSQLLQSQARYASVVFPVFLVLGAAGQNRYFDQIVRAGFFVLLGLLTALFALRFAIAMS